jgi:sugar lactone lactonase YvrE
LTAKKILSLLALLGLGQAHATKFSPFYAKYYLVAGAGEAGSKDGNFLEASFNKPGGLALSKDGDILYVADAGNHAIRAIALRNQNRVSSLAGGQGSGSSDGIGSAARLSAPAGVQLSADGDSLFILDQNGQALRSLDLRTRRLSTLYLFPKKREFSGMAVDSKTGQLYLSSGDSLLIWDKKAGQARLLAKSPGMDCPGTRLVLLGDQLMVCSPCGLGPIYRVRDGANPFPGAKRWSMDSDARLDLLPIKGQVLNSAASGFCALQDATNRWRLLYWDPGRRNLVGLDPASGSSVPFTMTDYQGTSLPTPSGDMIGINASSDSRLFLKQQVAMLTGASGMIYVAESASNRVLGVDSNLMLPNGAEANSFRMPETKPKDSTRLLLVGSSLIYYWRDYGPEKRYNVNLSFVRQLELNLNLESALQGRGQRYEVLCKGEQLGLMPGGTASYFLGLGKLLPGRQIDEVLIVIDYMSLSKELFSFLRQRTLNDLATLPVETDWLELSPAQKYKELGPLTRGLIDDVRKHPEPGMELDKSGALLLQGGRRLFENPRFQKFGVEVMRKALLKGQALARAHGARLSIVLLPTRDLVEIGEGGGDDFYDHINPPAMNQPLADMAAEIGVKCYDLTPDLRLVALPFYPLVIPVDHHYNYRAQGWLAYLLARQLLPLGESRSLAK